MRKLVLFSFCLLSFGFLRAQPTTIHGYEFTTGVDSTLWADMTVSTPWGLVGGEGWTPLPFPFSVWNRNYNRLVFYPDGTILFYYQLRSTPSLYFPDSINKIEPVTAGVFGYSMEGRHAVTMLSTDINVDSIGHRTIVFQMTCDSASASPRCWQMRLSEEDNSITLVYGTAGGGVTPARIGLMLDTGHVVMVDPSNHTASATGTASSAWPGRYRYYRFTPTTTLCPTPAGLHVESITPDGTELRMSWYPSVFYSSYRVEYGEPGFVEGEGTTVTVPDTTVLIQNLTPEDDVEVRVYANCPDPTSGPTSEGCSGYISMVVHMERVTPSYIYGHTFTTGINSQLWYDMDLAPGWSGEFYSYPFPVFFYDRNYYRQYDCLYGPLLLNAKNPYSFYLSFPSLNYNASAYNAGDISGIYGHVTIPRNRVPMKVKCFNADSIGHRVFVMQQSYLATRYLANNWQVQMREDDHSVTLVYGLPQFRNDNAIHIGLLFDTNHVIEINQDSHTAASPDGAWSSNVWPGQYRYYRFVPDDTLCPNPVLSVRGERLSSHLVRLVWESCPFHTQFQVEYGLPGFAEGGGTQVITNDTSLLLEGLQPDVEYEARVTALCPYGNTGYTSLVFRTPTNDPPGNQLFFAHIYADSVQCYTSSYGTPATINSPTNRVDFGSRSIMSRHAVHRDASESDSYYHYYNDVPSVLPAGFNSSVRLGDWRTGGDRESITYTLTVDTNRYDLLILHFTLAEYRGNSLPDIFPRFTLDIADSLGNSLGSCYPHDFVNGSFAGWIGEGVYNQTGRWRDWDSVGIDISPYHGRTIRVTLSHADYYHYGNAYFTLETGNKRIHAESCGDAAVGTFRAPKGFNYRWYSMSDTTTTLSTTSTLRVTVPGDYGCHLTSRFCNGDSGFYLRAFAGGRYPVASFTMQPLNSCGSQVRFSNQSVVARDSVHTQLTSFPCDAYLWNFDDGTTSSYVNPVHTFDEGTHTVTLYAMLANGDCVDSVSQTFTVTLQHDTIYDTICEGGSYQFFDQTLTEAGEYSHLAECIQTKLYLHFAPVYNTQVFDTFAMGDFYLFEGVRFWEPGVYQRGYATVQGCDSTIRLYLSCIDVRDTVVCSSFMPLEWNGVTFVEAGSDTLHHLIAEGVDNIVVQNLQVLNPPALDIVTEVSCHEQGGYLLSLPDTLCYQWASSPADSLLPPTQFPVFLSPTDTITYYLTVDRCDTLPCPLRDTFLLTPVAAVDARLAVSPVQLDEDHLDFTATDLTVQPHQRQWYFNSFPLLSTDSTVEYHASVSDDSVLVMLVTNTDVCTDTATRLVLVNIQSLWFPNVFTPRATENNLFRGYGTQVRDYDLRVYSRWANCIFHTSDINEGWDGTYRGKECPVGTYLYICHYTTLEGELQTASGVVTLLN